MLVPFAINACNASNPTVGMKDRRRKSISEFVNAVIAKGRMHVQRQSSEQSDGKHDHQSQAAKNLARVIVGEA